MEQKKKTAYVLKRRLQSFTKRTPTGSGIGQHRQGKWLGSTVSSITRYWIEPDLRSMTIREVLGFAGLIRRRLTILQMMAMIEAAHLNLPPLKSLTATTDAVFLLLGSRLYSSPSFRTGHGPRYR
jgi:hypothetical protein